MKRGLLSLLLALFVFTACDDTENTYDIPSEYSFENVDYSGQETRIEMLAEISAYAKTANSGAQVESAKLKAMFENANAPFSNPDLNTADKDLFSKTFEFDRADFLNFFDEFELATQSSATVGSNGTAGVVTSLDGSKAYFFDENGVEHIQLIEKGLMGACFYYQMVSVYLSDAKIGESVDNNAVTPGKGTAMEHHWDEAFGYTSFPTDYPNHSASLAFWAKYIDGRETELSSGTKLMDAFIKGRAAISANDMATKFEMAEVISTEMEKVVGGTAVHYINAALADYSDDALRNHTLSEAWAFIYSLKFNENKSISNEQIDEAITLLGTNFYEVSRADLSASKAIIVEALGLQAVADQL